MGIWDRFRKQKNSDSSEGSAKKADEASDRKSGKLYQAIEKFKDDITDSIDLDKIRSAKSNLKRKLSPDFSSFKKNTAIEAGIWLSAAGILSYCIADTVSLILVTLVPEPPTIPALTLKPKKERTRSIDEYSQITSRHIFNSLGLMPEDGTDNPPRKTSLPLNLIGTIILKDELKSMASIEDKTVNMTFPVKINDIVADKIKITKIEKFRVFFINQSSGNTEFVEILEEPSSLSGVNSFKPTPQSSSSSAPKKSTGAGITQIDETKFEIERSSVDKALSNLSEVLQQARAIPNFENGVPDGYKLIQIVPGSIYDQLGLKNGDVISGINGDALNDPSKAFQLFNELKMTNHLDLTVKRGGKKTVQTYDIR